jgi:hypothetical protein
LSAALLYGQEAGSPALSAKRARQKAARTEEPQVIRLSRVEHLILQAYRRPAYGQPTDHWEHEQLGDHSVLVEHYAPFEGGTNRPRWETHRDATGKADLSYRFDDPEEDAAPWGEWVRWRAEQEGGPE